MANQDVALMENRIVVITGGSRGLGRNTAVNLARRGVDVILTYRANQTEAESLIREIEKLGRKAAAFQLDVGMLQHWMVSLARSKRHCSVGDGIGLTIS